MKDFLEKEGHEVTLPYSLMDHGKIEKKFAKMSSELESTEFLVKAKKEIKKEGGLLQTDVRGVLDANVILAYIPKEARIYGTSGEITVAYFLKQFIHENKDILVITNFENHDFPLWILGCSDHVFDSFEDCKQYIRKTYKGK